MIADRVPFCVLLKAGDFRAKPICRRMQRIVGEVGIRFVVVAVVCPSNRTSFPGSVRWKRGATHKCAGCRACDGL